MEMGCPGANEKLESINFTQQVTAIGGGDAGGDGRRGEEPGGFGNSLIRRVNTKAGEVVRSPRPRNERMKDEKKEERIAVRLHERPRPI